MYCLWKMTYPLCYLSALPLLLAAPADRNAPRFGDPKSGDDIEQGALSRAINAEQRQEFPLFGAKANGIEYGAASV